MPPDPRSPRPPSPRLASFDFSTTTTPTAVYERIQELARRRRHNREQTNILRELQSLIRQQITRLNAWSNLSPPPNDIERMSTRRRRPSSSQQIFEELNEAHRALERSQTETSSILERIEAASGFLARARPGSLQGGPPRASTSTQQRLSSTDQSGRSPLPDGPMELTGATRRIRLSETASALENQMARLRSDLNRATQQLATVPTGPEAPNPMGIARLALGEGEYNQETPARLALADVERLGFILRPTSNTQLSPRRRRRLLTSLNRTASSPRANNPIQPSFTTSDRYRGFARSARVQISRPDGEADALFNSIARQSNRRRRLFTEVDLDDPDVQMFQSHVSRGNTTESESETNAQRLHRHLQKRRKISHSDDYEDYDPLQYGWKGQVDPGLLWLEIVSCDGGEFTKDHSIYRAENILRDDMTVYCSKAVKCTLLFRHQAETVFNVDSILIRGPEAGYTAPVQQGIVFVGMDSNKLMSNAAEYHMKYEDIVPNHGVLQASQDHSHDSTWTYQNSALMRQNEDGTEVDCDTSDVDMISTQAQLTTAPSPPYEPFFDDTDTSYGDLATGPRQPTIFSSGRPEPHPNPALQTGAATRRLSSFAAACVPPATYRSRIEREPNGALSGDDVINPQAQFRLYGNQKSILMKFNPPVSGRYILLKLFNPIRDTVNIDVQYVGVHGFSGPRYIPGIEMR